MTILTHDYIDINHRRRFIPVEDPDARRAR